MTEKDNICMKKYEEKVVDYYKNKFIKDAEYVVKYSNAEIDKINEKIKDPKNKDFVIKQDVVIKKWLKYLNNSIIDAKKSLNDINKQNEYAKISTKEFLKIFCNENCKDTLYEVGDTKKLLKLFFDSNIKKFNDTKNAGKIYKELMISKRNENYNGTSFTKNLNDKKINKLTKLGFVSYCDDTRFGDDKLTQYLKIVKSLKK